MSPHYFFWRRQTRELPMKKFLTATWPYSRPEEIRGDAGSKGILPEDDLLIKFLDDGGGLSTT